MDRRLERVFWTRKRKVATALVALSIPLAYIVLADLRVAKLRVDPHRLAIVEVVSGPFREHVPVVGNVLPLQTVFLETSEGGRVEELFLEEGSVVSAGAAILRLVNTDLQLDILRHEDQLFEQTNQLFNVRLQMQKQRLDFEQHLAELDNQILRQKRIHQRDAALAAEQLLSQLEYELSRDEYQFLLGQKERAQAREKEDEEFRAAQVEQMKEAVERQRHNLETAREKLDKLILRAPIDGQLTALDAEVGQAKAPGERLGQVDRTDGFKVRAEVDQLYVSRTAVGQSGEVDLGGTVYELQVSKVYPEVTDGRFEVEMQFTGEVPPGIKRGQTLQIRLALGDAADAVYVAKGPFFQKTGGRWIFVLAPDGELATRREIRLGRQNTDSFEVLSGLEPGERVIVSSYEEYGEVEQLVLERRDGR